MKRLLLVFIISFLTDAIVTSQNPAPSIVSLKDTIDFGYFTQKLDHTDPSNTKTWLQRYYVNHEYFNKDDRNVAFLYVGGDSAASYVWVEAGSYIESAKKIRGIII
ncbi:hypothetical protein NQ315_000829 [Exocentrus adspersus]|uniref:Uncharacterized protein n=1 Tax=Exocentrus adspersus TaxID=1586481 RepID=A0AAV8WEA4_9CUCU|nr:hypothetical protein NQ315_000829 [Exocentrus adspersus]